MGGGAAGMMAAGMAAQAGAQDPKFLQLPTRENFMPILEAGGADIMRISVAVELEGALELGE